MDSILFVLIHLLFTQASKVDIFNNISRFENWSTEWWKLVKGTQRGSTKVRKYTQSLAPEPSACTIPLSYSSRCAQVYVAQVRTWTIIPNCKFFPTELVANWCNGFWLLNSSYSVHLFHPHCYYPASSPLSAGLQQLLPKRSPSVLPRPLQAKLLSGVTEIIQKHNFIISLFCLNLSCCFPLPLGYNQPHNVLWEVLQDFMPASSPAFFLSSLYCTICTLSILDLLQFFKTCIFSQSWLFHKCVFCL